MKACIHNNCFKVAPADAQSQVKQAEKAREKRTDQRVLIRGR